MAKNGRSPSTPTDLLRRNALAMLNQLAAIFGSKKNAVSRSNPCILGGFLLASLRCGLFRSINHVRKSTSCIWKSVLSWLNN